MRHNGREMARLTDRPPGSPPPPRSPFLPPAPRPQPPPAAPALQQRAAAALVLAVLSLIAMLLIGNIQRAVYVVAVALVIAVLALVLALSALRAAKRAGARRPRGAMAGALLGGLGTLYTGLALIGLLAFWSQYMQYGNCLNGATTAAARSACEQQFKKAVGDRFTVLGNR